MPSATEPATTLRNVSSQPDRRVGRSPFTVGLNVRLTPEQATWLQGLADRAHGGNTSAALRRAVGDARLLELARDDYRERVGQEQDPETGETSAWRAVLTLDVREVDELAGEGDRA